MVGPTWMSVSWTIRNPSCARGSRSSRTHTLRTSTGLRTDRRAAAASPEPSAPVMPAVSRARKVRRAGIERWRRCDAPCDGRQQFQQITGNDHREQQKHDPEPDITSPNESAAEIALSAPENQRERNARCEQREKRATDGDPGRRPAWISYEARPQIVMNAGQQTERDGNEYKEAAHGLLLTRTDGESSLLPLHRPSFAASLRAQPGG